MTIDYDHDRNNVVKSDHGHFFCKMFGDKVLIPTFAKN